MTTDTREAIKAFLLGEAPLDGVWFGEKHPEYRGLYWWRDRVREHFAENAPTPAPAYDRELIAQMLYAAITYVNLDRFHTDEAVRAQIDALRAADNAAVLPPVAQPAEGGVPSDLYAVIIEAVTNASPRLGADHDNPAAHSKLNLRERETIAGAVMAALTAAGAAQGGGEAVALPVALQTVVDKARRFIETTEDEGSFDIGRDWAGVLTMLGLLVRTQRSPAIWCTTSAIDDLIEWDSRRLATPTPAAQPSDAWGSHPMHARALLANAYECDGRELSDDEVRAAQTAMLALSASPDLFRCVECDDHYRVGTPCDCESQPGTPGFVATPAAVGGDAETYDRMLVCDMLGQLIDILNGETPSYPYAVDAVTEQFDRLHSAAIAAEQGDSNGTR